MRRPGFISPLSLAASALVVVIVGVITWLAGGILFSPGPLSAQSRSGIALSGVTSHADLSGNCAACHPAPWSGDRLSDRCLACHTDVTSQLASSTGVHGLVAAGGGDCRTCHVDHLGASAVLTQFQGDAALHERTRFSLAQHSKQADGSPYACSACHATGYASFDQSACTGCHARLNPVFMAQHLAAYGADCLGCHDGKTHLATFDHGTTAFPLEGKHVGVACSVCHTGPTFAATSPTCSACHAKDDAHKGQFGTDCAACHKATGWPDATFDHGTTAFPLEGKHVGVACSVCHTGPTFAATSPTCSACHAKDDAHKGQFGTDCAACHKATGWPDATFDHSTTAFPLDGGHLKVSCTQCHANGVFKGTPTACAACHQAPATHVGTSFTGGCADCHATAAWQPAKLANHPFPIDHGGTTSACAVCHPASYAAYTCYGCHAHTPADIRTRHLDEGITDVTDCVKCHANGRGGG